MVHTQLSTLDDVLPSSRFADEFGSLHIFLSKAGDEDLRIARWISIVVNIDIPVGSVRDIREGSPVRWSSKRTPDYVLPSSVVRNAVSSWLAGLAWVISWP